MATQRIRAIAAQLGCSPNQLTAELASGRSDYLMAANLCVGAHKLRQLLDTFPTPFPSLLNWSASNALPTSGATWSGLAWQAYSWTDPISGATRAGFTEGPPLYVYPDQT